MEMKLFSNIGNLDHPNHNERIYDSAMMKKTIKDFNIEDSKVFGKIQLLDNENRKTVKELIDSEKLRLGPRMLGKSVPVLDENGNPINEIKDVEIVSMYIINANN